MKLMEKLYRNNLFIRNDNANGIFYFSASDFDGLQSHGYSFSSSMGHGLKGCFYHYENPAADRLVVFDHGMGNGHRAYMREIERLAKAGFLVFSYDHTGCMESGGESTNGFAQSLKDLNDCCFLPNLYIKSVSRPLYTSYNLFSFTYFYFKFYFYSSCADGGCFSLRSKLPLITAPSP